MASSTLKQSEAPSSTLSSLIESSDSLVKKIYAALIPGRVTLSEKEVLRTASKFRKRTHERPLTVTDNFAIIIRHKAGLTIDPNRVIIARST